MFQVIVEIFSQGKEGKGGKRGYRKLSPFYPNLFKFVSISLFLRVVWLA